MLFFVDDHLGVDVGTQLDPVLHNWMSLESSLIKERNIVRKTFSPSSLPSHFVTMWADIYGIKRLTF